MIKHFHFLAVVLMGLPFVVSCAFAMDRPFDGARAEAWELRSFELGQTAAQSNDQGNVGRAELAVPSLASSKCLLLAMSKDELVRKVTCFLISRMQPCGKLIVNERTASFLLEPRNVRLVKFVEYILNKSEILPIAVVYACMNLKKLPMSGVCKITALNVRRLFLSSCMVVDRGFREGYDWISIAAFFEYNPGLVNKMESDMRRLIHDQGVQIESEALFFHSFLQLVLSEDDFDRLLALGDN